MNVRQFLLILLARKKLILAVLAATVLLTLAYSLVQSKTYKATASVLLNYKGVDPLTGLTMPGQLLPGYMATQIDIISSKNVALRVVDQLKLAGSPAIVAQFREASDGHGTVQDWLADLLLRKLDIVPSRESSVLQISFKGADPTFVAAVANAFADEYQKLSVQLKTEPMKKASTYFDQQTRQLRDSLEAAQARLSKYQQEKGIVSLDNNRVDVELSRLNELSAQMVAAQAQSIEAGSRQRMASGAAANAPDVANNAMVQNLRISLGMAEAKLAEMGQRLARKLPQYVAFRAEVDQLRREYRGAVSNVSSSVGNNAEVLRHRESELRAAVAAQKVKVLELNRARDELGVLLKDVESAQRAFDTTSQRLSQTRIEGQSEQSDISVLNPATVPMEADGPRVLLNTLIAILLGTILGIAIALLAEVLNRPVRSPGDLRESLGIPVLGTIVWNPPRRRPRTSLKHLLTPRRLRLS